MASRPNCNSDYYCWHAAAISSHILFVYEYERQPRNNALVVNILEISGLKKFNISREKFRITKVRNYEIREIERQSVKLER